MWGDERFTVSIVTGSPAQIIAAVRNDIHPPLYFLLAHWWSKLPLGSDPLVRLRLLSVVFAVLTTMFIERRWLRSASEEVRAWFLMLWVFSPCLLLYSRMARSYSMQVFLSAAAIWFAVEFAEDPRPKRLWAFTVSLTALLYTHYLPGIAVLAGANVLLVWRMRQSGRSFWKTWLLPNALVAVAYLPWLITLGGALHNWGRMSVYALTGNVWTEQALKLGYWWYSFAFGEAIPIWLLPLTVLLALPYAWLVYSGARLRWSWVAPAAAAAGVAYLGATRWVTYPFMGARLLFLLPGFVLAAAAGISSKPRSGMVLGVLLFLANLAGVSGYFGARDILNIGYLAPHREIASEIVHRSAPENTVVWIDGLNLDGSVLQYYLPRTFEVHVLTTPESVAAALAELRKTNIQHVWFLRNPHDLSAGQALTKLEQDMRTNWYNRTLHPYVPFSPTHLAILRALAMLHHEEWRGSPRYMYEAWEFRRPR